MTYYCSQITLSTDTSLRGPSTSIINEIFCAPLPVINEVTLSTTHMAAADIDIDHDDSLGDCGKGPSFPIYSKN